MPTNTRLQSAKDEVSGCKEPVSLGSISELETQLIIADRLGFLSKEEIFPLIEKERSKLLGLIKYLRGEKNAKNQ